MILFLHCSEQMENYILSTLACTRDGIREEPLSVHNDQEMIMEPGVPSA